MPAEAFARAVPFWRRLAAEFVVIVTGVLVALAVDAAREARDDHVRASVYLRQLHADLSATAAALEDAIEVDTRMLDGADRAVRALASPRLAMTDSLTGWITAATNWSATFHPTMGTITALVESGELRLIHDEELRRQVLQYHSGVEASLRITDALDPLLWRTMERLSGMFSWPALLQPETPQRFPIDWESLASNRAFHGAVHDLKIAALNRLFALTTLREQLEVLRARLDVVLRTMS